jgi:hypothetical protein
MKIILEMTFTTTSKLRHVRPHLPHRPWASRGTGLSFTTVANPSSAWWARASRTASPTPSWCWERPVPKATTSSGSCGGYVLLIPLEPFAFSCRNNDSIFFAAADCSRHRFLWPSCIHTWGCCRKQKGPAFSVI